MKKLFSLLLIVLGCISVVIAQEGSRASLHAHCYGKIIATALTPCGTTAVVKTFEKGGYVGCPICNPKCRDYVRGVWDAIASDHPSDFTAMAQQVASCGQVKLEIWAACGTCDYSLSPDRSTIIDLGGHCVTTCDCPQGYTYDPNDGNCKRPLCAVSGTPDQAAGPNFFISGGVMYQIGKKFNCKTICKQ